MTLQREDFIRPETLQLYSQDMWGTSRLQLAKPHFPGTCRAIQELYEVYLVRQEGRKETSVKVLLSSFFFYFFFLDVLFLLLQHGSFLHSLLTPNQLSSSNLNLFSPSKSNAVLITHGQLLFRNSKQRYSLPLFTS